MLETDHPSGTRAWAKNGSSSDNQSVYKYGQADGSSRLDELSTMVRLTRRTIAMIRL